MRFSRLESQVGVHCFFALSVYAFKTGSSPEMDGYTILCLADNPHSNGANADTLETEVSKTTPHLESCYILWELIA